MSIDVGSSPPGWPCNNEILVDLGRMVEAGESLDRNDIEWLVAAANALSNALEEERS